MDHNICGPVVKRLREEAGITQTELTRRLRTLGWRTTQPHIKRLEAGVCKVRAQDIVLLSLVFSVSPGTLLGE